MGQPPTLKGQRLPPLDNDGAPLLSKLYRSVVVAIANAVSNFALRVDNGDGSMTDADVKLTEMGMVVTIPPLNIPASTSSLELTDGSTDLTGVTKITTSGLTVGGTPSAATLTVSALNLNYRGVWSGASTYSVGDCVSLGSGTSAGFYLSTINSNTNSPDSGIGWVQFSSYATWL